MHGEQPGTVGWFAALAKGNEVNGDHLLGVQPVGKDPKEQVAAHS